MQAQSRPATAKVILSF
ncbi:putative membrane protein, partial [Yersinia pestis PY-54]